jgi:hypothetical protein
MQTGQIFQTNQPNIFSIESDEEAGGYLNREGLQLQLSYLKGRSTEIALHDLV